MNRQCEVSVPLPPNSGVRGLTSAFDKKLFVRVDRKLRADSTCAIGFWCNSRRNSAMNAQTSDCELAFADAMHQFYASNRDRGIPELPEAKRKVKSFIVSVDLFPTEMKMDDH